eukprot:TRINITY_DN1830_c0_g1_i10.p1 TRINITY_DN1830_c0_g1~~TRINITY_DN1830_c0_g1_i10.p1  ORF type:complete len:180 (+),score=81.90 TRINITY_DN1830_c0_g1_i10:46-540(+)
MLRSLVGSEMCIRDRCYNCKALMVVQPQAATNLSMQQQLAQGGAMTPHMEKKQRKKREGPPRQPTAYNNFMKAELAKIKNENSDMHHREAFKIAAARWAESSENPKNQKAGIAAAPKPEEAPAAKEEVVDVPKPEDGQVAAPADSEPAPVADPVPEAPVPEPTA